MVDIVVIDRTYEHSNRCVGNNDSQRSQVVAYQRLKTIENSNTVSRKSGHDRLPEVAVYERFQYRL